MNSPEEQQLMQICLLKSDLEEVDNGLTATTNVMPSLDTENEQKYQKAMNELRVSRSLNTEIESLKLENVQLSAKRMQLKQQCENIRAAIEKARETRVQLEESYKQEEKCVEMEIRKYEDTLSKIAQRFRETQLFAIHNEDKISKETEMLNNTIIELKAEEARRQDDVRKLQREIQEMSASVPEDILDIVGQKELEEKVKTLTDEIEALYSKKEHLEKYAAFSNKNFL